MFSRETFYISHGKYFIFPTGNIILYFLDISAICSTMSHPRLDRRWRRGIRVSNICYFRHPAMMTGFTSGLISVEEHLHLGTPIGIWITDSDVSNYVRCRSGIWWCWLGSDYLEIVPTDSCKYVYWTVFERDGLWCEKPLMYMLLELA